MTSGELIRAHREAMGLTQVQLAARAGLSKPSVENLERNLYPMSLRAAQRLAAVFQIRPSQLIAETEAQ